MSWEQLYKLIGIEDFIAFVTNPFVQEALFPVKMVFILFAAFFFCAIIYFYINSSYLKYHVFQDVVEFFSWRPYGLGEVERRWKKIRDLIANDTEENMKMAIMQADDFLRYVMEERGYEGENFEELVKSAKLHIAIDVQAVMEAHAVRNSIVYDPDCRVETARAKEILSCYENVIKNIASS